MPKISERVTRLQPSATRAIAEKAGELRKTGKDIISLSTGEPDFVSPDAAMNAARVALEEGKTFYTPTAGIPELRSEVARYYETRFGVSCSASDVLIGAGAKPLLFETFATLLDPRDEVIIITPAWVSYVEQVRFFDGRPVILKTDTQSLDFNINDIRSAITSRTKAIVLNAPNNPSGRVYDDDDVIKLCRLVVEYGITLVNDEVYERILFDGLAYHHPIALCPEAAGHVLSINAVSKTYAMTGWRIGFAIGPSQLIKRMTMLQGHLTSGANSVAQWAALGAIREGQSDVEAMVAKYQGRKDLVVGLLDEIPLIRCIPPQGAFYIFIDIRALIGKTIGDVEITDDLSFCEALLEHGQLALVPGTAFLQPGFVRMSFATSSETVRLAMRRLNDFIQMLTS